MRYVTTVGTQQHTVALQENGHTLEVSLNDRTVTIDWRLVGSELAHTSGSSNYRADRYSVLLGAHSYEACARLVETDTAPEGADRTVEVLINGRPYVVTVRDERSQALASLAGGTHISGDATIRAPMPGLVSNVLATEGTEVKRGQTVVVLEAMKMENDLTAPRTGVVKAVRVSKGQTVNQGEVLAIVGDPTGAATPEDDEADEA